MKLDLLEELERIAAAARETQRNISDGRAVNGRSGLKKIEDMARDAVRHGRAQQEADRAGA